MSTDVVLNAQEILDYITNLVPPAVREKATETLTNVKTALTLPEQLTNDEVELLQNSVPRLEALQVAFDALWATHDQLAAALDEGDQESVVLLTVALVQRMDRWHELLMREPRFAWAP